VADVTVPFEPPLPPLVQAGEEIPRGARVELGALVGRVPAIAFRDDDQLDLQRRNGKPLNRYFPELKHLM